MDDREGELSLRQVLGKALVLSVLFMVLRETGNESKDDQADLCALQVHVIITDLEVYAEEVDERNVVSTSGHETGTACTEHTYTSTFFVEHAIMSLIATRNSPPVSVAL